jgi:hypothetical protein
MPSVGKALQRLHAPAVATWGAYVNTVGSVEEFQRSDGGEGVWAGVQARWGGKRGPRLDHPKPTGMGRTSSRIPIVWQGIRAVIGCHAYRHFASGNDRQTNRPREGNSEFSEGGGRQQRHPYRACASGTATRCASPAPGAHPPEEKKSSTARAQSTTRRLRLWPFARHGRSR